VETHGVLHATVLGPKLKIDTHETSGSKENPDQFQQTEPQPGRSELRPDTNPIGRELERHD
jgi:hypothetical protein